MSFLKKHKYKLIAAVFIAVVLIFAFWWGGSSPGLRGWEHEPLRIEEQVSPEPDFEQAPEETPESADEAAQDTEKPDAAFAAEEEAAAAQAEETPSDKAYSERNGMDIDEASGKDKYQTEPVPEGKPLPVEPQEAAVTDKELTCTLSVRCDTILDNIEWLAPEKAELVPEDGVIFPEQSVVFYEGESVFNLLLREMKKNKIHLEFENTPMYNSAYIEGIGNLYEYDCGELSGWMYKVNGWFPNYGCSRYQLKAGDKVEWVYTCNLGKDVGGAYAAAGE